MDNKEIILSKIADIMSRNGFLLRSNSEFKARLKCVGLGEYFRKYENFLVPYYYREGDVHKFENPNKEYNVFLGLDSIFTDLKSESKNGEIVLLLKELTKSFNISYISEFLILDFKELTNLYELLGLSMALEYDEILEQGKVIVTTCMANNSQRVVELFSVEDWLKQSHREVYDAYEAAINTYTQGYAGACIESCRTCLVSIFSEYKGTESFAKWMRGMYNISGESTVFTLQDLTQTLNSDLRKEELAEFFYENRAGKLTKTKTIYMIYSMMSDYGTHRNESIQEKPSMEDALFSLRLMDSILFWIYSRKK